MMMQAHTGILALLWTLSPLFAQGGAHSDACLPLYPLPGSTMIPPATSIAFRVGTLLRGQGLLNSVIVSVKGAASGEHGGSLHVAVDGTTVLFNPAVPFVPGERVDVQIAFNPPFGSTGMPKPVEYSFDTGYPVKTHPILTAAPAGGLQLFRDGAGIYGGTRLRNLAADTLPSGFPAITVITRNNPPPLSLFLSDFPFDPSVHYTPYLMTLNNDGAPTLIKRSGNDCFDFKRQPNGLLTYYDIGDFCFYAMDSSTMAVVDTFRCGNGYTTDNHELLLLPNGHALLLAYDAERVRMDTVVKGGDSAAIVYGSIVQELDSGKNVVFQWRSWDHFRITDAIGIDLTKPVVDYVHTNAIEVDADGNLVISSRHLSEITKIDRQTGDMLWRWGGKNNQFTFTNDTAGFNWQHDIRRLPDGHWTLFDNGNFHFPAPYSRAVEYVLDEQHKTATLFWQYRHSPDIFGEAMGSVQRFDDGSTLIGWGATNPTATLINASGGTLLELSLPAGLFSYRAFGVRSGDVATSIPPIRPSPEIPVLEPAYPNPFNPSTVITYRTASGGHVRVRILDPIGREVEVLVDGWEAAGTHAVSWNASRYASGVYFCLCEVGGAIMTTKLVLLR